MTVFNDHEIFSDERICDRCSSKDKKIGNQGQNTVLFAK